MDTIILFDSFYHFEWIQKLIADNVSFRIWQFQTVSFESPYYHRYLKYLIYDKQYVLFLNIYNTHKISITSSVWMQSSIHRSHIHVCCAATAYCLMYSSLEGTTFKNLQLVQLKCSWTNTTTSLIISSVDVFKNLMLLNVIVDFLLLLTLINFFYLFSICDQITAEGGGWVGEETTPPKT